MVDLYLLHIWPPHAVDLYVYILMYMMYMVMYMVMRQFCLKER